MADLCGVYGIFDAESGECLYIGESTQIHRRWDTHLKALLAGNHVRADFARWFLEQGDTKDAIEFRILEECVPESLGSTERIYFDLYRPRFFGQVPHADRQWFLTDETRRRISDSMRLRFSTPGFRNTWQATVETHGLERAVELTTAHFKGDSAHGARGGSGNKGKRKSEAHKAKIAASLLKREGGQASKLTEVVLKSALLEGPTNITKLSERFGVSRPTIRKYLERFELTELLAQNLLSPYSSLACPQCGRETTKNWLKRHLRTCQGSI